MAAVLAVAAAAQPQGYASGVTPLTMYHVNPASYVPTPLNMDTGDDPTICPNRSATFPDDGDEPDCKLPCELAVPYHGGATWSMQPSAQPPQGPGALEAWAANMARAGDIMREHGHVIDTERGAALHVSLQYLCCQTARDVAIVADVYKQHTWALRNLTFERAVCRTDYDDAGRGMYTSVIVLLDAPSNARMEALAASLEDEIEQRGVKLTQRRAQQQPFHSTLGAVHTKRPNGADKGAAAAAYPIVDAVQDINRQIPIWHAEPVVVGTPKFSASAGPAALITPPWAFVPPNRQEICVTAGNDSRWAFLAMPEGSPPPAGWPLCTLRRGSNPGPVDSSATHVGAKSVQTYSSLSTCLRPRTVRSRVARRRSVA